MPDVPPEGESPVEEITPPSGEDPAEDNKPDSSDSSGNSNHSSHKKDDKDEEESNDETEPDGSYEDEPVEDMTGGTTEGEDTEIENPFDEPIVEESGEVPEEEIPEDVTEKPLFPVFPERY